MIKSNKIDLNLILQDKDIEQFCITQCIYTMNNIKFKSYYICIEIKNYTIL